MVFITAELILASIALSPLVFARPLPLPSEACVVREVESPYTRDLGSYNSDSDVLVARTPGNALAHAAGARLSDTAADMLGVAPMTPEEQARLDQFLSIPWGERPQDTLYQYVYQEPYNRSPSTPRPATPGTPATPAPPASQDDDGAAAIWTQLGIPRPAEFANARGTSPSSSSNPPTTGTPASGGVGGSSSGNAGVELEDGYDSDTSTLVDFPFGTVSGGDQAQIQSPPGSLSAGPSGRQSPPVSRPSTSNGSADRQRSGNASASNSAPAPQQRRQSTGSHSSSSHSRALKPSTSAPTKSKREFDESMDGLVTRGEIGGRRRSVERVYRRYLEELLEEMN